MHWVPFEITGSCDYERMHMAGSVHFGMCKHLICTHTQLKSILVLSRKKQ